VELILGPPLDGLEQKDETMASGSLNRVMLIGTLGRDPEVRTFSNGNRVCNLSIATSESWKDKSTGERKEKTEWHKIAIFNDRLVEVAERYLTKGQTVFLEGQIETRKYTDGAGVEKYTTEIVLRQFQGSLTMLSKPAGNSGDGPPAARPAAPRAARPAREAGGGSIDNDEIPFSACVD
jgi:single-strand DNA-binding protein